MAAYLKAQKVERQTGRCAVCYRVVSKSGVFGITNSGLANHNCNVK